MEEEKIAYKVGDQVLLTGIRPNLWNSQGGMDRYLNTVVTISQVNNHSFFIVGDTTERWQFQFRDIVCLATPELIEEAEKQKAELLSRYCVDKKAIGEIANDIFGEKRVDVKNSGGYFIITVHFPHIDITNSLDLHHVIKDMFVEFHINPYDVTQVTKCSVDMFGRRTTLSVKELESGKYCHSHLNSLDIGDLGQFCLGNSDFKMILHTIALEPTPENWYLLFFSLENYLSWESLEGGPYKKIENLAYTNSSVSRQDLESEFDSFYQRIPNEVFEYSDNKLKVIPNHPALHNFYKETSRIKNLKTNANKLDKLAQLNRQIDRRSITFKDEKVFLKYYIEEETADSDQQYSSEVSSYYNSFLNEKLNKFNHEYRYNLSKNSSDKDIFREARTIE